VPGIGKKGAERLVLELRDRIGSVDPVAVPDLGAPGAGWQASVREGLLGLGWSAKEAEDAVAVVAADFEGKPVEVATALRRAIQVLGKNR
jgi:Holliday junction DNA helicase RuvA